MPDSVAMEASSNLSGSNRSSMPTPSSYPHSYHTLNPSPASVIGCADINFEFACAQMDNPTQGAPYDAHVAPKSNLAVFSCIFSRRENQTHDQKAIVLSPVSRQAVRWNALICPPTPERFD